MKTPVPRNRFWGSPFSCYCLFKDEIVGNSSPLRRASSSTSLHRVAGQLPVHRAASNQSLRQSPPSGLPSPCQRLLFGWRNPENSLLIYYIYVLIEEDWSILSSVRFGLQDFVEPVGSFRDLKVCKGIVWYWGAKRRCEIVLSRSFHYIEPSFVFKWLYKLRTSFS